MDQVESASSDSVRAHEAAALLLGSSRSALCHATDGANSGVCGARLDACCVGTAMPGIIGAALGAKALCMKRSMQCPAVLKFQGVVVSWLTLKGIQAKTCTRRPSCRLPLTHLTSYSTTLGISHASCNHRPPPSPGRYIPCVVVPAYCMGDARAEVRSLIVERDVLEQRIAVSSERLRARGVDEHTPLVDREARLHVPCLSALWSMEPCRWPGLGAEQRGAIAGPESVQDKPDKLVSIAGLPTGGCC